MQIRTPFAEARVFAIKKSLLSGCLFIISLWSTPAAQIVADTFSYEDGALVSAVGSDWATHSGVTNQVNISDGRAVLTETESEDVSLPLGGGPYTSGNLYAGFTVNFSVLPSGVGGYFASFRSSAFDFRARLYASTTGAAAGTLRLGIGNSSTASSTAVFIPLNLFLNTDYQVVIRYNTGALVNPVSSLWVNPISEGDTLNRGDATDSFAGFPGIAHFSLRQSLTSGNGMGTLTVDDLKVGTDFVSVVPEPQSGLLIGVALLAGWRSRRNLQTA